MTTFSLLGTAALTAFTVVKSKQLSDLMDRCPTTGCASDNGSPPWAAR